MDDLLTPLTNGILHKNWIVITGVILVFGVRFARKAGFLAKIDPKYLPGVTMGLGVLLAMGDNLLSATTSTNWSETLVRGLMAGLSATGLWEAGLKHVDKSTGSKGSTGFVLPTPSEADLSATGWREAGLMPEPESSERAPESNSNSEPSA